MNVKLLLDENLSPWVAQSLSRLTGVDCCHVRDRGLLAATDRAVLHRALAEDRILVTSNVADFERLARSVELHAGIVLLQRGDLLREEQLAALRRVTRRVVKHGDMMNTLLRVATDGTMVFETLP